MKKGLKYLLIGWGMAVKLFGVPQEADCPTLENKLDIKSYDKNIDYLNTTNVKKVADFYDLCRENYF